MQTAPRYVALLRLATIFLRNHKRGIVAMDFIVVPTVRFRSSYAWFVTVLNGKHFQRLLHEYVE